MGLIARRDFLSFVAAATAAPALARGGDNQGRIETVADFNPRVRIWLPPGYRNSTCTYATLYMLDGQLAFSGDSDGINFAAERRIASLAAVCTIKPTLIVAIDNLENDRFLQYMPQAIYDRAEGELRAAIDREIARVGKKTLVSFEFVEFLEGRLKPTIDSLYRTRPSRLDTAIFGASMAGVMAGAIFVEAQRTFGRAACMSPNWAIYDKRMTDHPELPAMWTEYFARLGAPDGRRLWLDHGTEMMDAGMAPHQSAIAHSLIGLGWQRGCNLQTRVYAAGHAYAETAVQMDETLAWLLA